MVRKKWFHAICTLVSCCVYYVAHTFLSRKYLWDILIVVLLLYHAIALEISALTQDGIFADRKWHLARILFQLIPYLLLFVFFHNLLFCGIHNCIHFYPAISTDAWREAFIAIAEAIGIGSAVIMAIIGVLDKREFGISMARLAEFCYRGYTKFIIAHFALIVELIFFSYAGYFEVAIVSLVCVLYISAALALIFSLLILETTNRRIFSLQYYHKEIEKSENPGSHISLLINYLNSNNDPNASELLYQIVIGFCRIASEYKVQKISPRADIETLAGSTKAIHFDTVKKIEQLASYWISLSESKNMAYRNTIVEEIEKKYAEDTLNDQQQIILALSYIFASIRGYTQSGLSFGQALASVQADIYYNVSDEDILNSRFWNIAKLALSLAFWLYVFRDHASCDYTHFRNIALQSRSSLQFHPYKHIFFSFLFLIFAQPVVSQLGKKELCCFTADCNIAWNQTVEPAPTEPMGV